MDKYPLPAISHEINFIAEHTDEADAILDRNIKVDESLAKLSDVVYARANKDVIALLEELGGAVDLGLKGLLRTKWVRLSTGDWEINGSMYMPKRPKKRLATIGLHVGFRSLAGQLICWVYPKGGLDSRRNFARQCNLKNLKVHLVSDEADQYPGWDDCVVWSKKNLTLKTSRDDLINEIAKETKRFFKIARPLMRALANSK
jgi:hypothetical protein